MPDPNAHVRYLFLSERDREAVSRATSDGLVEHTPVSTVSGLTETMGFLMSP